MGRSERDVVGFGDDVSAIKLPNSRLAVLKTDMLVGSTDIPNGMTLEQAARKAVVANVSDLAAKGVRPYAGLVALGLPATLSEHNVRQIADGLSSAAREYEFPLLGGDTGESKDLVISICLLGLVNARKIILRSGAKIGDVVAVTGNFGSAAAGLRAVLDHKIRAERLPSDLGKALYHPNAQLETGIRLASSGAITASIDSSDGLASSLYQLGKMSGVGVRVTNVPVSRGAREFAARYGYNALDLALYGGEEYHLIVTVKPDLFSAARKAAGGRLKRIGLVTRRAEGIRLSKNGKEALIQMKGWEHFRS